MKKNIPFDDTAQDSNNLPHVSLIIPFRVEMAKQPGLLKFLAFSADIAEKDLLNKYSKEEIIPVMKKLRHLIQDVKCSKNEKTLALFVSASSEMICYFTPSIAAQRYLPVLVENGCLN